MRLLMHEACRLLGDLTTGGLFLRHTVLGKLLGRAIFHGARRVPAIYLKIRELLDETR
jgi:hypothetical protein